MENVELEYMNIIGDGYDIHVSSKRFRAISVGRYSTMAHVIIIALFGGVCYGITIAMASGLTFWLSLVVPSIVGVIVIFALVSYSSIVAKKRAALQKLPLDQQMLINGKSFEIFNHDVTRITFRKSYLFGEIRVTTEKGTKKFRVEKGLSQTVTTALKLVYRDNFMTF
jgi:hypothetical protein